MQNALGQPSSPMHAPSAAPIIESKRLILRPHGVQDLDACSALWSHPAVFEHISGRASTRQETWFRILRYAGLWPLLGFGYWAVEAKNSGRFIGEVGFADFKRAMEPSLGDHPEIGWILDPALHGKGYATEAVGAALAWMDRAATASITTCIISPRNHASLGLARKSGYREFARATYQDNAVIIMQRERPMIA